MTKSKLTFPDNMLTFMYFINNFKHVLLLLSGDIEVNLGPKKYLTKFCHWNLHGLAACCFIKVPLVEVFLLTSNFHIVGLSKTF